MIPLNITVTRKDDNNIFGKLEMNVDDNGTPKKIIEYTESYHCENGHDAFMTIDLINTELAKKIVKIGEIYPSIIKEIEGWDRIVAKSKTGDTSLS